MTRKQFQGDSTRRFTDRVENYVKYRPDYPAEVVPYLAETIGFTPQMVLADIGSGTGKLTQLFLDNGNPVYGVEPNDAMRAAAEKLLSSYPNFTSTNGTAEATTLPDNSVDLITAGQAFHWFKPQPTALEFRRILRPGGYVLLIWNERDTTTSPFMAAYEQTLTELAIDYRQYEHKNSGAMEIDEFLPAVGIQTMQQASFVNYQNFDFTGFKGRTLSSSYSPLPGHPKYEAFITGLQQLFDQQQQAGRVQFKYETRLYFGQSLH